MEGLKSLIAQILINFVGRYTLILLHDYMGLLRGPLSGEWEQLIYDEKGQLVKRDRVKLRHIKDTVMGSIRREWSKKGDETYKRWKFLGRVRHRLLFAIFWTTDERRNPESYGTIQLLSKGEEMEGFYVRLIIRGEELAIREELRNIKLKWRRL